MRCSTYVLAALLCACGDSAASGGGGVGGEDDGRFHPEENGVPIDEHPACERVLGALQDQALGMGCVSTFASCDQFVRTNSGETCAQYDEGSVDGCIAYYGEAADCADLLARSDDCALAVIAGSAPAGCPE